MRTLIALLLAGASLLADPTVKLQTDEFIEAQSGSTVDLLVIVDPGPTGLKVEGLEVVATAPGGTLQAPILPHPDTKGVYGAPFTVRIPMEVSAEAPFDVTAKVTGTHGDGKTFTAEGKGKVFASAPAGAPGGLGIGLLGPAPGELTVKSAVLRDTPATAGQRNALIVELEMSGEAEGWYTYGGASDGGIGAPMIFEILPSGPEDDFRSVGPFVPPDEKYKGTFKIEIPVTPVRDGEYTTRLKVFWQACDPNICLPEKLRYVDVSWNAEPGDGTIVDPLRPTGENALAGASIWTLFLLAFGAGLIALAMPCTYPLIPITISFFTKQGEAGKNTTGLATAYGLGIVMIFAAIGAVVGLGVLQGQQVLDIATNKWVNLVFALLFLYFGLSLIGLYEINLPSFLQNFAAKAGGGGSGYASVFAMGTTLVITSFTCTAPFVGALLVYAAQSGDWLRVTAAMGVFGLTMAVPFVILSLSPKALSNLPKSGIWMKHLKVTLGILELGLVLKFVSNIDLAVGTYLIDRETFILLWGLSFLVAAIYLMDLPTLFRDRANWKLGRGSMVAIVFLLSVTGLIYSGLDGKPLPPRFKYLEAFFPNPNPP
ncbi:MAG: cytochrome c biogenesis protein CcdA, partial [Planctomycetota bacterium]